VRMYYDNGRFYAGDISFTLPDKCSIDLDFDVVPNGLLLHSLEHDYFDLGIGISHYEDDYKHDFQEQIEESSRQATFSDFTINNLDGFSAQYTGMDGQSFEVVFPIRCAAANTDDEREDDNSLSILIHVPSPHDLKAVLNLPFTRQLFSSLQREDSLLAKTKD